MIGKRKALVAMAVFAASVPAHAAVTISTAATQNMDCSGGTCVPTATKAVLNASDLENDLSQFGNVRVMTTGTGVEANNIVVSAPFSSPNSTSLTLDAHKAITINAAVSIGSGTAELELQSGKGGALGTLTFGRKGNITFGSLSDIFGINGGIFTLVGSVQGLATAVAANPSGAFALANSYDAKQDGTYSRSPIQTALTGRFDGLGNAILHLSIDDSQKFDSVGLFREFGDESTFATIENVRVTNARVVSSGKNSAVGVLAGGGVGTLSGVSVSGHVTGGSLSFAGGLIGGSAGGSILYSSAAVEVSSGLRKLGGVAGGLVGIISGSVSESYATGAVSAGSGGLAGGLVGDNDRGAIVNCLATGPVSTASSGFDGGLVGQNFGATITTSYSVGPVSGGSGSTLGGLVAADQNGSYTDDYWDTTTSGIGQGCGNDTCTGVSGLTTQQFQSGLPTGFDPKVWAENPNINNGLPYLIANPPPK